MLEIRLWPEGTLDSALRYAECEWSVIPVHSAREGHCSCGTLNCPAAAKHPRIRWESAMAERAPPQRIREWWIRWPDANVGVVTGVVSRLAVLDVDPRNGGDAALSALEDSIGPLPITPEARTGGGGRHLFFRLEDAVSSRDLGPGLELKAEGGMVVAPPSRHAGGRRYRWRPGGDPESIELAPLPDLVAPPHPASHRAARDDPPVRTPSEQADFAETWSHAGVHLQPGDRYYVCPFHDDHHPSLHIDAEGCRWYCFGCAAGGGIGALVRRLGEQRPPRPRTRLHASRGRGLPVSLHGAREVDVVGESHHQDELLELTGGRRRYGGVDVEAVAELVPDPANLYDRDAIEVRIDGRTVGHVARSDQPWLRPFVDESLDMHRIATCRAFIRGGWDRGRDSVGFFGVVLLLPHPDDELW